MENRPMLNKPYTDKQRMDFIVEYNHRKGLKIEETSSCLYALEDCEILENGIPAISPAYYVEQEKIQKEEQKLKILSQLDELDKKRIRVVCEPSMKTETQSWLEYYNEQISQLRQELSEL